MSVSTRSALAVHGGEPAIRQPLPPMFPGGMRIGREEEDAVLDVLRSKRLFRYYGPGKSSSRVEALEHAIEGVIGVSHCVAVSAGMAAIMAGLAAVGVGPGDEVIVPSYTWIASPAAVIALGGVPVIAEIDESLTLDPADVRARISPRTKAILAVHMRGAPSRMDALMALATEHGIPVIEDVAQAMGGRFGGRRLGGIGDVGAFSLQFNKIITAGEGGLVITNNDRFHERIVMYTDVAGALRGLRSEQPVSELHVGVNLRMAELLGAVALVQLDRLDSLIAAMRANKARICNAIRDAAKARGVQFRKLNDPDGDTGIAIILLFPTVSQAAFATEALAAEGADPLLLYQPDKPDFHVSAHWAPIMTQQTWSEHGGPWRWHSPDFRYDPQDCPRSLDLLGRAIQLHVSPDLTLGQCDELALAVTKVLAAMD